MYILKKDDNILGFYSTYEEAEVELEKLNDDTINIEEFLEPIFFELLMK